MGPDKKERESENVLNELHLEIQVFGEKLYLKIGDLYLKGKEEFNMFNSSRIKKSNSLILKAKILQSCKKL